MNYKSFSDVNYAIVNYYDYLNILSGMLHNEKIKDWWNSNKININSASVHQDWTDKFELYHVLQSWPSTAGGWGGIGGAAVSTYHTTIITNMSFKIAFIYYGINLIYIAVIDDKFLEYQKHSFKHLPGLPNCESSLNILYKSKR